MSLETIPEPYRSQLLSMYRGEAQTGADGQPHTIDTKVRIPEEQGEWLYRTCRELRPTATLEIGLAYGYSTLFLLAALSQNGTGEHTAIDPFQDAYWGGVGRTHAAQTPMASNFHLIEDFSFPVLGKLAQGDAKFDMIYIDGNHRFDDVLVDFTLSAQLCPIGGVIALDDLWMPSITAAVSFIQNNRTDFAVLPTTHKNIASFKRIADDTRAWSHYVEFRDDAASGGSLVQTIKRTLLKR